MPILLNFVNTKAQNVEDIYRPPELYEEPEPPLPPPQSGSSSGLLSTPEQPDCGTDADCEDQPCVMQNKRVKGEVLADVYSVSTSQDCAITCTADPTCSHWTWTPVTLRCLTKNDFKGFVLKISVS